MRLETLLGDTVESAELRPAFESWLADDEKLPQHQAVAIAFGLAPLAEEKV